MTDPSDDECAVMRKHQSRSPEETRTFDGGCEFAGFRDRHGIVRLRGSSAGGRGGDPLGFGSDGFPRLPGRGELHLAPVSPSHGIHGNGVIRPIHPETRETSVYVPWEVVIVSPPHDAHQRPGPHLAHHLEHQACHAFGTAVFVSPRNARIDSYLAGFPEPPDTKRGLTTPHPFPRARSKPH